MQNLGGAANFQPGAQVYAVFKGVKAVCFIVYNQAFRKAAKEESPFKIFMTGIRAVDLKQIGKNVVFLRAVVRQAAC